MVFHVGYIAMAVPIAVGRANAGVWGARAGVALADIAKYWRNVP